MQKFAAYIFGCFFLVMCFSVSVAFAEGLTEIRKAADIYKNELTAQYQSKRSLKRIQEDILHYGKKRHPNYSQMRDFHSEYIANGGQTADDWLSYIGVMRQSNFRLYNYLPTNRSFWEPTMNTLVLSGFNALKVAKTPTQKTKSYQALLSFLQEVNDHPQAGRGGYKLFALEASLAQEILKMQDIPLRGLAQKRLKSVEGLLTQKVLDYEVKKNTTHPQLCLKMRLPLKMRGVKYEDYLRLTPHTKITALPMENKELCLRGFDFDKDYTVKILQGVPTALEIGHALIDAQTHRFNFGDRDPLVRLTDGKYVLSRDTVDGIPVETVNIDKLEMRVAKAITERALPHTAQNLDRQLGQYDFSAFFQSSGEPVWTGEMDVKNTQNENITTYFPVGQVLKNPEPGVYAIEAQFKKDKKIVASDRQFFVVTDIALTSLSAENGLYVFARSLKTAKPLANIRVDLVSRNNTILGTGKTDRHGMYRFPATLTKGTAGRAPMLVNANARKDYAFLRLNTAAYDLSDRGVSGRYYPGPIDSFVYTDRGVYRPGETVNIVALARDDQGMALVDAPLTIKVKRPDWVDHVEKTYTKTDLGGVHLQMDMPDNARMGAWSVQVFSDPKAPAIGSATFRVEDYVPPQIETQVTLDETVLKTDATYIYNVQGDYLYGAPAAGLKTSAEIVVMKDDTPFAAYKDYSFGLLQQDVTPKRYTLPTVRTDEDGVANIAARIDTADLADITVPLKTRLRASMFEKSGRAVSAIADRALRHQQVYLGIKQIQKSGGEGRDAVQTFSIIALNESGARIALDNLQYKLVKEDYFYNWYNNRNGWRYERQYFDTPIEKNVLSIPQDKDLIVTAPTGLDYWSRYRIEVAHFESGAASSRHMSGYWGGTDEDTPDTVTISTAQDSVKIGATAQVFIKPPYAGQATVMAVHNNVLDVQQTYIPAAGKNMEFTVTEDWGAGAYILVSLVRPDAKTKQQRGGLRGMGVKWLSVDRTQSNKLSVSFTVPDKVLPRQVFELPVQVTGLAAGEKSYLTIAAVDEGVLQLTDFKNPNPFGFYFGQRRLGVFIRDIYGKLLTGGEGRIGKIRSGGGAMRDASAAGDAFKPENYIETAALFSGLVQPDKNGHARVKLDLPDFNGRLRLMAVAYSKDKIGQGDGALIVRDPVVVQGGLPRFLAPQDKTQLIVHVQNMDGPEGKYNMTLTADGAVAPDGVLQQNLHLAKGSDETLVFPLKTLPKTGDAHIAVTLQGPENFSVSKSWDFDVRPYQILHTNDLAVKIEPSKTYELQNQADKYWPGTITASSILAPQNSLNVQSLIDSLQRYPYGCTEQMVSTSTPLLNWKKLHTDWGVKITGDTDLLKRNVQAAIGRVSNNMRSDGSFGYWRAFDDSNVWLSAYATEYLLEAAKAGYSVSHAVLQKAVTYLKRKTANPSTHPEQLAASSYAFYVLAKFGEIDVAPIRHFYDTYAARLEVNWALAMLGSGLNRFGETARAQEAFEKALTRVEMDKPYRYWYYGSKLRNKAVLLAMLAENQNLSLRFDGLLDDLVALYGAQKYFSTQERVWLARAAMNMSPQQSKDIHFILSPQGTDVQTDKAYSVHLAKDADDLAALQIDNVGDTPVYMRLNILGAPKAQLPAEEKGYTITRDYYTLDGAPALADGKVTQNTLLVAVVEGKIGKQQNRSHENLVVDMLPAGFELENADLSGGKGAGELGWLLNDKNMTNLSYSELKDDRYVASFRKKNSFKLVYLVRAVTPGVYAHPGVYVEDMYHPGLYGRGTAGQVTIVEDTP